MIKLKISFFWGGIIFATLLLFMHSAQTQSDYLPPEKAFQLEGYENKHSVVIRFKIAPGYYIYRNSLEIRVHNNLNLQEESKTILEEIKLPSGIVKYDENLQKEVETFHELLEFELPIQVASKNFQLQIRSQGCAEKGICYPPLIQLLNVSLRRFGGDGQITLIKNKSAEAGERSFLNSEWLNQSEVLVKANQISQTLPANQTTFEKEKLNSIDNEKQNTLAYILAKGQWWAVVGAFFFAGVLLSLTPCVLPMVPILSSIVLGEAAAKGASVSRWRGVWLSAAYSLGMALIYTILGVIAGLAGEGFAGALQHPVFLSLYAVFLLVLAMSMFGWYELQFSQRLQGWLAHRLQDWQGGRFLSVFAMGGVSALLVSPCVAAPLAGALLYISQTRDVWLGGTALFALASGMSVLLVVAGGSAGVLVPRSGPWVKGVKILFGFVLLGLAIWMIQPLLPHTGREKGSVLQKIGFQRIESVAALDAALAQASKPVMLDFYADWCVSCKEMEKLTFSKAEVQDKLANFTLLQIDVTANSEEDQRLLKRFKLFGPPGILFFKPYGQGEILGTRVIGYQESDVFLAWLQKVSAAL